MKFTLSWLKDHLETSADAATVAAALTDLGLEVEGLEDPAAALTAFTICRVIEAAPHPNADRLRLCRVQTWPDGPDAPSREVQVVCGAPNARTGLVGVFAAPGTYIPGTDMTLKPGVIRDVASNGMLCSERELMISDAHDGVIDLPEDAPLGMRYVDYAGLDDPVIEIAITPNRPDALGVRGIARDLAARGLGRLIPAPVAPVPGAYVSPVDVSLRPDVADGACPLFVGRHIRGVRNGPSPDWLQRRLRAIGLRPINTLVDITNFMTHDRARPLHVFDAARVTGDIHVRLSQAGETLEALDGKTYTFDNTMTLICDDAGPEAIGGIMGGALSGCSEETTEVFVESAWFDPVRTAATGRKLRVQSDARYRFERGVDPAFARDGMELATRLILDLCGGEPSELIIAGAPPETARRYDLRADRVETLVGMRVEPAEQRRVLEALGFDVAETGAGFDVGVPSWRPDVGGEADLVEEVARIVSLSGLEAVPLPRAPGVARAVLTPMQLRVMAARRALAAAGMNECVTYSFIPSAAAAAFDGGDAARRVENPISSEMSDMRPTPLPGLLAAAARNQARGEDAIALFEIGVGFEGGEAGEETELAAGLFAGSTAAREWSGARRPVDLHDAKAAALRVLEASGAPVERLMTMRDAPGWLHPGRSASLKLGPKNRLAVFGELHPRVLAALDVKGPVSAFQVWLEAVPFPKSKGTTRPALTRHDLQSVERDFAFVVDERVEAEAILRAARGADKALIDRVGVFDVFEGKRAAAQLGEGRKSVAITVRLQPRSATLTDARIEAVAARVVAAVGKATGGTLRG